MDALTHGIIGIAVGGLSGQPLSYDNPIYLAALLGSQAPDFDILAMMRGGLSYLRQHRAASHSLPGIIVWATVIAAVLHYFIPAATFASLLSWALAGALSHIVMDYFNTHGAALFWPLIPQRLSCNLLNVFDPFLELILLSAYGTDLPRQQVSLVSFIAMAGYLLLRVALKYRTTHCLRRRFAAFKIKRLLVMPSLEKFFYWDFIVETTGHYVIGRISSLSQALRVSSILPKQLYSPIMEHAQDTMLGKFFTIFSPFTYFDLKQQGGSTKVEIYDLRYFQQNNFIHRGMMVYDDNNNLCDSYVQSYGRKLKIPS